MRIGIMQGRLSPPQNEALQFFPKDWKAEFAAARTLGFETIEWIYEEPAENPLVTAVGRAQIRMLSQRHRVFVESICADIFMHRHLTIENSPAVPALIYLLECADLLGARLVSIPFLEDNLPETDVQLKVAAENIREVLRSEQGEVELALEVDLPAEHILVLLEAINSPRVGVCYDTGNAMTHGFDAGADIRKLGRHLKEIHFKDRLKGTRQSVYLGEGSVDFPDVFEALEEVNFQGLGILQAWRGEDYLGDAKRQLEFVKQFLK